MAQYMRKAGLILSSFLVAVFGFGLMMANDVASVEAANEQSPGQKQATVDSLKNVFGDFGEAIGGMILETGAGVTVSYDPYTGEKIVAVNEDLGMVGKSGQVLNMVTSLPISGSDYLISSLSDLGLEVPSAKAQGYGYYALNGIQEVWRIFRNVAYVFFTVIILAVGFVILFGQKLDSQATLTVQKALPRIIAGIVLVTFSYAIAGFMIDIMYLAMYLFGGLFNLPVGGMTTSTLMGQSIFNLAGTMVGGGFNSMLDLTNGIASATISEGAYESPLSGGGILEFIIASVVGLAAKLLGFIFAIIVLFAMLFAVWKLFVTLLKSYVLVVMNVMFSPLLLILGVFPNYPGGFKRWILAMIGNLSAFVGVFVILTVYYFLINLQVTYGGDVSNAYFFTPPFIIPVGGGNQVNLAMSALTLGLLLTTPTLIEKIRDKMGAKKGFLGEMAGEAMKAVSKAAPTAAYALGGATAAAATATLKGTQKIGGSSALGTWSGQALTQLEKSGVAPGQSAAAAFGATGSKARTEASRIASAGPVKYTASYLEKRQDDWEQYMNYIGQAEFTFNQYATATDSIGMAKHNSARLWRNQYTTGGNPTQEKFRFWRSKGKEAPPRS